MDNVEYKSCIVPMCKNNSEIAPSLSFFEVPTNTHKHIIEKWQEAIGISMDGNTVMYCCQDHFDLQDDTYNYVEHYMSDDANSGNKIQLQLKYDAVPHRFECQYHLGLRIKPVSTDCNAIEGSRSDIDPLTGFIPTTRPLEEINRNDINILSNSTTDSDVEKVLEPVKDPNEVKETKILAINAIESSSSDIDALHVSNNCTKGSDADEVLEHIKDPNEMKEPEIPTTNATEVSSSDIGPLTCLIPSTPRLEEINHSDVNISNYSTKELDVEEVLESIKDTNEVKNKEILTTNAIGGSSSDLYPLPCFIPSTPRLEEINDNDVNNSNDSTKDSNIEEVLEPIKDPNEVKEPEIFTINGIEGSSSDINTLHVSNNCTKGSDTDEVLEHIKDPNEMKEPEIPTTNATEVSSSDIGPLTCFIPSTPRLEEINHSDVNISNYSTKELDVEEVLEFIKDTNEVKNKEILTTNAIEGSSSDLYPLPCFIPSTPPLAEIKDNDVNISNDSNVEEVLEPIKDPNEVKEPEIFTINAIEGSSSDIDTLHVSNYSTKDSDADEVLEVLEPIKDPNEMKEPEIPTTNANEVSTSDIDPLTCFIPSSPTLVEINLSKVNISNDSTKGSDVEEVLEPIKDSNEVKKPEILTTNAIEGSSSGICPLKCFIPSMPPLTEIKDNDVNISNYSTKNSDVEEVLESEEPEIFTINATEGSSSDTNPLTCFILSTPRLEEINHSDVNISNDSTKDSDVEEALEAIKDKNEVKKPEILTANAIEGSSSGIYPLPCFIPSTPPLEEIKDNDENISNDSTKDSDVEQVLERIKDPNEVKEPEIFTINVIEGSSADMDTLTCFIPSTPSQDISNISTKDSDVEDVLEPVKDANEVKEPEIFTINAIEGSSADMDTLTCFIQSTPPLDISNDSAKDSDVEEVLEPIKDTNEVKEPEILTTNANSKIRIIDNTIVNKARLLNIYKNKRLMALCKPLKIQIEDLKNILDPKIDHLVKTDVIIKRAQEYGMAFKRKQNEIAEIVLQKRRRLITRIITWDREQSHCIAIHDLQCKEIDIYYLNNDLDITTYKRIVDVSRLSENEQYIFKTEFKGRDDRLRVKQCCCWFNRENVIGQSLANYVRKSIEFTKKKHPCKGSICTCCCRNIPIINSYSTLPDMDKTITISLKNIKARRSTRLGHVLASSAIVKAMNITPKVQIDNIVRINDDSASLNIIINNDCYQINNGHLVLYTKLEDCPEFSNIPLVVNKNVCCWYARENVLNILLKQKVSVSAVKFMKAMHLCPITACKCCCKPKQDNKKTHLPRVYAITRHTSDTSWKNMKIKIVFSSVVRSSSKLPPLTKTKTSQKNTSKIRTLDNKILRYKTPVSNVPVSKTKTLQNKTPVTHVPVSKTRTLQNETSISKFPASNPAVSNPIILQNTTNETSKTIQFYIARTIDEQFSASQDFSELDPTDTQESTSNTSISEPISQPFVVHTVPESTSFHDAFMRSLNDPSNPDFEMDNTPNNNLILTSVVSSAGVQSSDETVVLNNDLNTVTDVVVVPDNPDITNSLLPTYITPKPKKERFQRSRAKNPANCKRKSSITPTSSFSDLNKNPISVHSENEESIQNIQSAEMAPTVGSIISMADLSDVSVPVLSDETQDSSQPSICTFIHVPKTDLSSFVANILTSKAPSTPVPMQAPMPACVQELNQASSSKKSFVTKATKSNNKKTLNIPGSTNDTLTSSTVDILQKLNNIRFIHSPGYPLSAQLKTTLKKLSTIELQILNSVFIMVEHQIKAAGLVNREISFNLNNLFDNITLPENETTKVESIVKAAPAEMYTRLGSLASLKQVRDTESFNALLKRKSKNKPLLSNTTKRGVRFSLETTKIHKYVAGSSSFKKVKRK